MKENVLEVFSELGFALEAVGNLGYEFLYEGTKFLCFRNDDDEEFLSIAIPGIFEMDENNQEKFFALMEYLNSSPKYVKSYRMEKSLWLFYERELLGEKDLKLVVARMIARLDDAWRSGRTFLKTFGKDEQAAAAGEAEEICENDDEEK